uniref:Uncharacterized protein n=1 Tax=viral metagenome TaxID=1070528 RepID=A0A6C0IHN0_9ZZZZ
MDFSIRDIIRETRASINARLDMLELLIQNSKPQIQIQSNPIDLSRIEFMLGSLSSKMEAIENKMNDNKHEELPSIILEETQQIQETQERKEIIIKEEEKEEEEIEQEIEQELTEFEYKGMLLYRDGENKVYQMDEDGELVDTPIGIWNEAKQKVQRI